jgi:hypothetical protein
LIRRDRVLDQFELRILKKEKADYRKNLALVEAMFEEARRFGVFPSCDPLEGIDVDIRIARAINYVRGTP